MQLSKFILIGNTSGLFDQSKTIWAEFDTSFVALI